MIGLQRSGVEGPQLRVAGHAPMAQQADQALSLGVGARSENLLSCLGYDSHWYIERGRSGAALSQALLTVTREFKRTIDDASNLPDPFR